MKKLLSILLILVMLFSTLTVIAASSTDTTLEHQLTCDGKTLYTAKPGEIITVTVSLENKTANEGFTIKNFQTEIYYDPSFFEYVGEITIDESAANPNWTMKEDVHYGERRVSIFVVTDINAMLDCESKQTIATFKLKVKEDVAEDAQGTVNCRMDDVGVFGPDFNVYGETTTPLTVVIGEEEPQTSYTITYINDGAVIETATATPTVVIAKAPQKDGKRFLGWKDEEGKLWQPDEVYTATKETTFTAEWGDLLPVEEYTLTFVTNGGSEIASITRTSGTVIDLSSYSSTRSGYTLVGWYTDEALTNNVTAVTLDSNKTVYAKWLKNYTGGSSSGVKKITITFETPDGIDLGEVEKIYNTTVDLTKYSYEKEGYTFEGWYTDKELTNKVTSITLKGDITLYAKWVEGEDTSSSTPNYHPDILTTEHYAYIVGREGGYICPQDNITRAEVATIFFRLLTEEIRNDNLTKENVFSDVTADAWYNTAVSTLAYLDILKGRTEDTFEPNAYITRAEFTTIAARFSDVVYEGEDLFSDIDGHWAKDYINAAASIGWIVGENGMFRPDDNITRAEVMTLVNRVLNRIPENKDDLLDGMTTWNDNADANAWYYLAVQEATNSHTYTMKADGIHESWNSLTENPDWTELEK